MKSKTRTSRLGNFLLVIIFILSTAYFIYQHSASLSWDFEVYILNAKHWVYNSQFFEIGRAPMASLFLAVFLLAGESAPYLYIVFVSALFFYSSVKLADALKLSKLTVYILSMNTAVLFIGLRVGSELLSLALLELFICGILLKKEKGGLFLGFAFLARYNSMIFLPLLLFYKKPSRILKACLFFLIPVVLWLLFCQLAYGHFLYSVADEYAKNVFYRTDIIERVKLMHFIDILGFLLPIMLSGIIFFLLELKKSKLQDWLMIAVAVLAVYSYVFVPVKLARYLFMLLLPAVFFSAKSLSKLKPVLKYSILSLFLILTLLSIAWLDKASCASPDRQTREHYISVKDKILELNADNCSVKSNAYVFLNSAGILSTDAPRKELFEYYYDKGYVIVLDESIPYPGYADLKSYNHLYRGEDYVVIRNPAKCERKGDFSGSYLVQLKEIVLLWKNKAIETDPCVILFNSTVLRNVCGHEPD
ncbi:MAG: hypothetical protein V1659_04875 [Candidatus Woesearchaeota archaeon]